jgi:hypothetical protein
MNIMEDEKLNYLKKWKSKLEEENSLLNSQLQQFENERLELVYKRNVLIHVLNRYSNVPSHELDDFKSTIGYDDILSQLKEKDEKSTSIKKEISKKIAYNNTIIKEIDYEIL